MDAQAALQVTGDPDHQILNNTLKKIWQKWPLQSIKHFPGINF